MDLTWSFQGLTFPLAMVFDIDLRDDLDPKSMDNDIRQMLSQKVNYIAKLSQEFWTETFRSGSWLLFGRVSLPFIQKGLFC